MGMIPEALCVEAPKGQPEIRGETLEAVYVEALEGQPRNHRPHPREQPSQGPRGEKPGKPGRRRDPPSSRWKKAGEVRKKEGGDHFHGPPRGELDPSGRTWTGT